MSVTTGRFSAKLLATVAALSLMGSGVAVADDVDNGDVTTDVAVSNEVSATPEAQVLEDESEGATDEVTPDAEESTLDVEPSEEASDEAVLEDEDASVDDEDVLDDEGGADKNVVPDEYLRKCINNALGYGSKDTRGISAATLKTITKDVSCSAVVDISKDIYSLEGVQYLTNTKRISLGSVSDKASLAPLSKLKNTKLTSLTIYGDWDNKKKQKFPNLSGLPNLKQIDFNNVPLSNIENIQYNKNLTSVHMFYGYLTDVSPLAKLPKIKTISLYDNDIKDISSLANIKTLADLSVENNQLTSIPKRTVQTTGAELKTTVLRVNENHIKDYKNAKTWRIYEDYKQNQNIALKGTVKNKKTTVDISSLRDADGSLPTKVYLTGENIYHKPMALKDSPGSVSKDGKTATFNQVFKNGDIIYAEGKGIAGWFITLNTGIEPVTSLKISGASRVYVGSSIVLKAKVSPSKASNKGVSWKSANPKIATVDKNGKVTGKKAGTVTITATAKDGFGAQKTRQIVVVQPVKVSSVKLSGASSVVTGKTVTLKATVSPSNASNKGVSWSSSNKNIATVNSAGKVTAKKAGTVTITATAKDGSKKKATKKITVTKVVAKPKPTATSKPKPTATSKPVTTSTQKVYRLYNPATSEHLFTTDVNEYKVLAAKHGWKQEGVAWVGPKSSNAGVYRLYNPGLGDHHYTKDKNEARSLVAKFGWRYDNNGKPLFYSDSKQRVKVYRCYNPKLQIGQHHYTADKNEYNALVKKHGWKDEGIGWYAIRLQ
ncbi:MAG: Ig-like domain-containing protein [Actinomycetaceae bacterium]|nr:Ig-like domain-containing protein [Actinomycetaceae bacterium]